MEIVMQVVPGRFVTKGMPLRVERRTAPPWAAECAGEFVRDTYSHEAPDCIGEALEDSNPFTKERVGVLVRLR